MAPNQNRALTTTDISKHVHDWAPGLKDFALVEFNQANFFKSAIMAITENYQLMECMKTAPGRESMYNAMKRAFSTGLSLNPQEGKAAIIAYGGKASYQIMKEGAIEIVLDSEDIKSLQVEIVYENDVFEITKSSDGDTFTFSPARKNRGSVDGYFCSILGTDGKSYIKYMTEEECFEVRDNHSAMFKSKPELSPWTKSPKGMCKKTVVKAAIRDLHISSGAKSRFAAEDMSIHQDQAKPPPKDITPPKGSSADDVAGKLAGKKKTTPPAQKAAQEPPPDERF